MLSVGPKNDERNYGQERQERQVRGEGGQRTVHVRMLQLCAAAVWTRRGELRPTYVFFVH